MSEKLEAETLNELCRIARLRFGENAVEALVGALSSVCRIEQLEKLVERWALNVTE